MSLPARRPAESAAVGGAVALIIGYFLGVDNPGVLTAIGVVIGALPGIVTWLVELARNGKRNGTPAG